MKIAGRSNYKPGPKEECASPPYSIVPLLENIETYRLTILGIPRDQFVIWEPAPGYYEEKTHTYMIEAFRRAGYSVVYREGVDFLTADIDAINKYLRREHQIKIIITNPPFSVALKRRFVEKCNSLYKSRGLPFALLMNITTLTEKTNGQVLKGCTVHIPFGRICFGMPNKGWGTPDEPTTATFPTAWFTKGLCKPGTVCYDEFDMSNHFEALKRFGRKMKGPYWKEGEGRRERNIE